MSTKPSFLPDLIEYIDQAAFSYHQYINKPLIENPTNLINELYDSSFIFAAHKYKTRLLGESADEPRFVFGNAKALELWELDWDNFIGMPSRLTAEPEEQGLREALFKEVREKGYINNYSGIRISSTGKRFQINSAIVWNVLDSSAKTIGQAVKFSDYKYL